MNGIFSYYTKYSEHINDYKNWSKQQQVNGAKNLSSEDIQKLKNKAKAIAEPILVLDNYEHVKAEDSETFFQTYNIELMSIASLIASLPIAVTKIIPFLNKHASKSNLINSISKFLTSYKNKSLNILGKNLPLPKAFSAVSFLTGAFIFAKGIKGSMESQLGLIRKASFDGTQNIINDPKIFAQLSKKQQSMIDCELNFEHKNKSDFVDKLKDRIDINSSFRSVKDYNMNKKDYLSRKTEYLSDANAKSGSILSDEQLNDANSDKILLESYLNNVEHAVLEPLRKVETISNISYSSLFTGGFLEYLITDKLADVLRVQNKPLRMLMKLGVPLLTYFILNKNISNLENKAILATKYKYLKHFVQNPLDGYKPQENQTLPQFIKTVYQDMKEYDKFEQTQLPLLKDKQEAKKRLNLSDTQIKEAKRLQKNTSMVINNQRESLFEQSVGIKALSETILGPLDIIATAVGGKIGHSFSKKVQNKKIAGMLTGLGAILAFIPAAIVEAKLTKEQKLSEKIAAMLAIKDIQDVNKFADTSKTDYLKIFSGNSEIFKDFI